MQLAVCVLQQRADADSPWGPFLRSWPCEPPPLPKNLDSTELAEAQDELFEVRLGLGLRLELGLWLWLGLGLGLGFALGLG